MSSNEVYLLRTGFASISPCEPGVMSANCSCTLIKARDDDKVRKRARVAIAFLDEELGRQDSAVVGQGMAEEDAVRKYTAAGNDDLILQTCLHLMSQANLVLCYTNDKMLGIKAKQCGIHVTR